MSGSVPSPKGSSLPVPAADPAFSVNLAQRPDPTQPVTTPWGLHVFDVHHPWNGPAERLETVVFETEYGNTDAVMRTEYDPYRPATTWAAIVHHPTTQIVGLWRFLTGPADTLKSIHDLRAEWDFPLTPNPHPHAHLLATRPVCDIATLSVAPQWRRYNRRQASLLTIATLPHLTRRTGTNLWLMIVDDRAVRYLQHVAGYRFTPVADLPVKQYLDSAASFPAIYDFTRFWDEYKSPYRDVDLIVRERHPDVSVPPNTPTWDDIGQPEPAA